jgi:aminodeoxyfutalosine synthase
MSTLTSFEQYMERVSRGERLSPHEIHELAETPDIISLGMLADAVRRRLHGDKVTFVRVATVPFDSRPTDLPPAAHEVRFTGSGDLVATLEAVAAVKPIAGHRIVSACSWTDIEAWSGASSVDSVLSRLKAAGLDALAELPLDLLGDPSECVRRLRDTGFAHLRLTFSKAPMEARTTLLLQAAELQDRLGCIQSINPLSLTLSAFRPTTGYEDVKMVAIARVAAPNIPCVQVDWPRYGPKLAQVALTFGADDIDGVSASDEAPEGRRRAPLAEIIRNIEAAAFQPIERDGRFKPL